MAATSPDVIAASAGPAPLPLLAYADLPSRWGVAVQQLADGVRVVVPPCPGWRHLGTAFHVGPAVLAFLVVAGALASFSTGDLAPLLGNMLVYGVALVCVVALAFDRLLRRLVFEVTANEVTVTRVSGFAPARRLGWPRHRVARIKINRHNGKLLFWVTGVTIVEWYVSPNRELTAFVADTLADALGRGGAE